MQIKGSARVSFRSGSNVGKEPIVRIAVISLLICILSVILLFLFIPHHKILGTNDPVAAFENGTLVDCRDGKKLFAPQQVDAAAVLDEADMVRITAYYPGFFYRNDAVLFAHRITPDALKESDLFTYVFLTRVQNGGYCAHASMHGPNYPFDKDLLNKYKH